ncbi:hypothetical protein LCGC14_1953210, partial [marine sediment metagenome]
DQYRISGNITLAAELSGNHRPTVYTWEKNDPEFALQMLDASEEAKDRLEGEAHRRGVVGVEKPVIYQGKIAKEPDSKTGELKPIMIREYSDHLLTVLLNASRPEKFKFRHEHTGPGGQDLFKPFIEAMKTVS